MKTVVIGVITVIVACIMGCVEARKRVMNHVDDGSVTRKTWVKPAIYAYLIIIFSIAIEAVVSFEIVKVLRLVENYYIKMIILALENGVGIVICWPFVFYCFDKELRKVGIDNQREYSVSTSKRCAALIVWLFCIVALLKLKGEYNEVNGNMVFLYNRIVMWAIAPIGEFIVRREKKKHKEEKDRRQDEVYSIKEFAEKYSPVVIGMIILLVVAVLGAWYSEMTIRCVCYFLLWLLVYATVYLWVVNSISPSLEVSIRRFKRKTKRYNNKGHFGRMKYSYCNNRLMIESVKVGKTLRDKNVEFDELFGPLTKEDCDEEEALSILQERLGAQQKYFNDSYSD